MLGVPAVHTESEKRGGVGGRIRARARMCTHVMQGAVAEAGPFTPLAALCQETHF
jgi:hypothetical protein